MHYEKTGDFPDGGCYNDQPVRLLQDWDTLDRRYADIYEKMKDDEDYLPPTLSGAIEDELEDEAPAPVGGLFQLLRGAG